MKFSYFCCVDAGSVAGSCFCLFQSMMVLEKTSFCRLQFLLTILTLRVVSGMSYSNNESNILMCVILLLLICTALRAHITVVEMLYEIKCYMTKCQKVCKESGQKGLNFFKLM